MAENSANDISWYLRTTAEHIDALAAIRPWTNLKVAFEGEDVWVSGFSYDQIESVEVRSNPYASTYYAQGAKLFLKGSLLPDRNIPGVLWTPILRAFPIKLPSFNHNYFGIDQQVSLSLIPSDTERAPVAMLTDLARLKGYIETAPAIRMTLLTWILIDRQKALLIGQPLLPVQGEIFWQRGDFLLPAGYDFDLHVLATSLNKKLNPESSHWILWRAGQQYLRIPKEDLRTLSRGTFRLILKETLEEDL